ncbi:hypothetical protein, partial [Paenibacillus xylaniclasticus]|uniref:hypothetical protein n=1 Tax=Paenibacillus xylaniclasticus TaxID=588083 RepID=UPI0013DEF79D
GENKPRIISLPTYPFARERYWISDIKTKEGAIESEGAARSQSTHTASKKIAAAASGAEASVGANHASISAAVPSYIRNIQSRISTSEALKRKPAVSYLAVEDKGTPSAVVDSGANSVSE